MDEKTKKILKPIAIAGAKIAANIVARKVYDSFFGRYERPDYNVTPGLINYKDFESFLPREKMHIKSKDATLQAYFYENASSKDLILLAHGFHAGADDFLPVIAYLVQKGYSVLTYDMTGTYDSTGKGTIGFCQWLVDCDYVIKFIQNDKKFKKLNLYLLGHSCGGYAVSAVLSLKKHIKACATIAAPNNGYTLLLEKGTQYAGEFANQGVSKDFLDSYQKKLFGKYCNYSGLQGVNSSKVPTFIAHGLEDEVIDFDLQSLISHRDEMKNKNLQFYFGTGSQSKHNSILFSDHANELQESFEKSAKLVKKEYKKNKEKLVEEKNALCLNINNHEFSEINYNLFDQIIEFFKAHK